MEIIDIAEELRDEAGRMDEVASAARAVGDRITDAAARLMAESYRRLARGAAGRHPGWHGHTGPGWWMEHAHPDGGVPHRHDGSVTEVK